MDLQRPWVLSPVLTHTLQPAACTQEIFILVFPSFPNIKVIQVNSNVFPLCTKLPKRILTLILAVLKAILMYTDHLWVLSVNTSHCIFWFFTIKKITISVNSVRHTAVKYIRSPGTLQTARSDIPHCLSQHGGPVLGFSGEHPV